MHLFRHFLLFLSTFFLSSNIALGVCPEYAYQSGHLCYEAHFERAVSFKNANEVCHHDQARLAVITNNEISKTFSRLAIKNIFENFWVKDSINSSCTALKISDAEYHLDKDNCKQNMFAICEIKSRQCSRHNWKFGDVCYQVSWFTSKYLQADKLCRKNGATLAVLDTIEKVDFIRTALNNDDWWMKIPETEIKHIGIKNIGHFWTGAKYDVNLMTWVSYELEPLNYFQNQFNTTSEKCISKANEHYRLNDCESHKFFFCEFPANRSYEIAVIPELLLTGSDENGVHSTGQTTILAGYVIAFLIGCVVSATVSLLYCRKRYKMERIQDNLTNAEYHSKDDNQRNDAEMIPLEDLNGETSLYSNDPKDYRKS